MSDDLLAAVEAAAVRGWPALEQCVVDGWIWRYASGGSIRANSVAALDWRGTDLERAISTCETLYQARGAACVFTVSDASHPRDLDAHLDARGYHRGDDHVTMLKPIATDAVWPADVGVSDQPSEAWMATYLSGLSPDRRGIAATLIANLGLRARFVTRSLGGETAGSSGLTVLDGPLASVQCMATLPQSRRAGGAWHVLSAIEILAQRSGASHLYLQTGGDNQAAQALYTKFGFRTLGRYHTRTSP